MGDANLDGKVDCLDVEPVQRAFGNTRFQHGCFGLRHLFTDSNRCVACTGLDRATAYRNVYGSCVAGHRPASDKWAARGTRSPRKKAKEADAHKLGRATPDQESTQQLVAR